MKYILRRVGRVISIFFFFQAEDGIRDVAVTGVQTCALPIYSQKSAKDGGKNRALHKSLLCLNLDRVARRRRKDGSGLERGAPRFLQRTFWGGRTDEFSKAKLRANLGWMPDPGAGVLARLTARPPGSYAVVLRFAFCRCPKVAGSTD